ncbi:MAG TPA: hypothetical protein DCX21_04775 [Eubacterium sp.]|nr:hypothetical protein [Eubacterium sp.]
MKKNICYICIWLCLGFMSVLGMTTNVLADDDVVKEIVATDNADTITVVLVSRHANPWDYPMSGQKLTIGGKDIQFTWGMSEIKDNYYADIPGASISSIEGNDVLVSTITIPKSYTGDATVVECRGVSYEIKAASEVVEPSEAVYEGIVIDGSYDDWAAVSKEDLMEPDGKNYVVSSAIIYDNDVYIYLKDSGNESATGAGSHGNGKYSIVTDLGRTLVFQLDRDGNINGVDGATCAHNGTRWEIKIPAESLPKNNGTISFGLYLCDPTFTDVKNMSKTDEEPEHDFSGISYDYLYGDWDGYPHSEIEYATAGTGRDIADAEAAIYFSDDIYGHVYTDMVDHVIAGGGEMTNNITLRFNNNPETQLFFNLVAVDEAGNINWYPKLKDLPEGTYEFYICNSDAWHTSPDIYTLYGTDQIFGKAFLTVSPGHDEMEWVVYSKEVSKKFGFSEEDIKVVSCRYGELGDQWIVTAGVSTGGLAGAALCMAVAAGATVIYRKKVRF